MSDIGVIAIGRNEGDRLGRCLASVVGRGMAVVYVDSNSTDGSPERAGALGASVVALDLSIPFSAARARNEGFDRLMQLAPDARFVQFVDGDCEIVAGWLESARAALDARPDVAVVCGRRRERFPGVSIYNRLADLEWDTPIGEARSCGGDAMMRVSAFKQAGGFDASVVAGEEPELCQRLRGAGWKILRIGAEMTLHDSAMLRFGQWWTRAVRGGYGAMDVATRFRNDKDPLFANQVRSARLWGRRLPIALAGVIAVAAALIAIERAAMGKALGAGGWAALALASAAALLAPFALQSARMALRARRRGARARAAAAYGLLTVASKFAQCAGQRRYRQDRAAGRNTRLIDYKAAGAVPRASHA